MEALVRPVRAGDIASVCSIYNSYVAETHVTFEEVPVQADAMSERVAAIASALPYLVCEIAGDVAGYAYATRWRDRSAYRYSVEVSAYVRSGMVGRGVGSLLYGELIPRIDALGIHAVLAGIAQPNAASEALHARFGFEKVAHLREVGWKLGRWIDVAYWERIPPDA